MPDDLPSLESLGDGSDRQAPMDVDLPVLARTRSLAAAVYESLRQGIADGRLPPEYRLREVWLARHYGVSTTPVREALRQLEREGLVTISPHRGAVVAAFDVHAALSLYEAREVIELAAAHRAAMADSADFAEADRILADMAAVQANPDQTEFNRLDVEFHRALNEQSGNEVLADLAERVHRQIQSIRARASVYLAGRPAESHTEHIALLAAIRRHDPDEAERLVRAHLHGIRDRVIEALREGRRST